MESVILSVDIFFKLQIKGLSSAKRVNFTKNEHFGKSLRNMRYNRGPSIEPWGTPELIVESLELWPFNDVNCFLSAKYDSNQLKATPFIPYQLNFLSNISWSTQSKTFAKSKKNEATTDPLSKLL